jgi:hypothetical protein
LLATAATATLSGHRRAWRTDADAVQVHAWVAVDQAPVAIRPAADGPHRARRAFVSGLTPCHVRRQKAAFRQRRLMAGSVSSRGNQEAASQRHAPPRQ